MNEIKFIDYSYFFNNNIKAYQILFNKSLESLTLDKFREHIVNQFSISIDDIAIPNQIHSNETKWIKNPTMLCNWCDYRQICQDSWSE